MKYLRKIVALLIALVMMAALIIGLGVIFAVKNVNVSLLSYSYAVGDTGAELAISKFKTSLSSEYKGRLMLSVGESSVKECVESMPDDDGNMYVLESFYKEFPCTLNITLRERRETYFRVTENGIKEVYDEKGEFLRVVTDGEVLNKLDASPDVEICGVETQEEVKEIAKVCAIFSTEFSALRSVVKSVEIHKAVSQYDGDRITFRLRCGLLVKLRDYTNLTERKLAEAAKTFGELSGEEKLCGEIVALTVNGFVRADYSDKVIDEN